MSIEKLIRLQEKAGLDNVTDLCIEFDTIKSNYRIDDKPIMIYLTSKYIHGETRDIVSWYADHLEIFEPRYFKTLQKRQTPQEFDPHRFP